MIWIGGLLCMFWALQGWTLTGFLKHRRLERLVNEVKVPEKWPFVSILVPARNEEREIRHCLSRLLELDYPVFEIIAIDDRSTDGTGSIICDLAKRDSRIRPLIIHELPKGWLGKNNALHQGSQMAQGEYLLFTDGDVLFEPSALKQSIRYAMGTQTDHLVLVPAGLADGFLERAFKYFILFGFLLFVKAGSIRSKSPDVYVGMGAFNLVKRSAYDAVGGHEALRMEIVDDLLLGKNIKQGGFSQDLLLGLEALRLRWYDGVGETVRGLKKNMFASLDFSLGKTVFVTFIFFAMYLFPYLAFIWTQEAATWIFALLLVEMHLIFAYFAKKVQGGWLTTCTIPVVAFIEIVTLWNSAFSTLKQGGIQWRDTFYSIEQLKRKT